MDFLLCFFCAIFIQIAFGQVPYTGQNANSAGQMQQYFSNKNGRGTVPNAQLVGNVPMANQMARNAENNRNSLAKLANANLANANGNIGLGNTNLINQDQVRANLANANGNIGLGNTNLINQDQVRANLANTNLENASLVTQKLTNADLKNSNLPFTASNLVNSNLANANLPAQNVASNIPGYLTQSNLQAANYANLGNADSNLSKLANLNYMGANLARPDFAKQLYPSNFAQKSLAGPISGNVASPFMSPNAVNSNYGNLNFANGRSTNPYLNSGPVGNQAGGLPGTNFANGYPANVIATDNLANGLNFGIGGNPFTVIGASHDNNPFGLRIAAEALEISGTVSVSGEMPIYGTVSLTGNLPAEGSSSVNYGCSSQYNYA